MNLQSKIVTARGWQLWVIIFSLVGLSCSKRKENPTIAATITDYLYVTSYGQSNSNGGGRGELVSGVHIFNTLMPAEGVRIDSGGVYFPLIPLTESYSESPLSGSAESFLSLFHTENPAAFQSTEFHIIATASGQGGYPIHYLSKGIRPFISGRVSPYNRIIEQVTTLKKYSNDRSKSFSVPFMYFTQGEAEYIPSFNTSYTDYRRYLLTLINDLNTDILKITGQSKPFPFIGYQVTEGIYQGTNYQRAWTVSKVQYDEGIDPVSPYVIACPSYMFRYELIDHFVPADARIYGAYLGIAAKRTFIDGKKFLPMHPVSLTHSGKNIQIKFYAPVYPIVVDTSIPYAPNYGFKIVRNSLTNDTIAITSVKVIDENTISIDVAEDPAGDTLYYAVDPQSNARTDSTTKSFWFASRGNLHDSQTITFGGTVLYNYCTRFMLPIKK